MNRDERIIQLKLDVIFKRVFGDDKNENIIASFISSLLEIPRDSIRKILIHNVELAPEYFDQKFSRLDLKMDVDGRIVNIEMQVTREPDFRNRTLFYWAKIFSEELRSGEGYESLKQTICINIINFNLFDCGEYHSFFQVMEQDRHEILSNKFAIHFFELQKLSRAASHKPMDDWLRLINAETEGELMDLQEKTAIPEVRDTIVLLRRLNADEAVRQEAYMREKRLHDEASAMLHAQQEGRNEGLKEGRKEGLREGKKEERERIIALMKEDGYTDEQIARLFRSRA